MKKLVAFLFLITPIFVFGANKPGYYRFPAVYDNTIVFTAEGDLWTVSIEGGVANRLTTHHGVESHPSISPDGTTIAFSAQYEGPTEVYTMPLNGGVPERRTFSGESAYVAGWTPDGKVLYTTRKFSTLPNYQLVAIDLNSNTQDLIPLAQANDGVFDPDGSTIFFTRLHFQGSYTKRYKGGTVQNLWKYTYGTEEAIPMTGDYTGTSKDPMWFDGRIYFVSDRDGTMNIWSMTIDGNDLTQHTFHNGWDVSNPSLHNGKIVYQVVADLYLFDIISSDNKKIEISLVSDFDQMRDRWVKNPKDYLTSTGMSPEGDKVVLTARGQVFVAPAKSGRLVRVTKKEGVRYRNARFLPDGENIIVLSDETGELEFWKFPANGVGEGKALTNDGEVLRWAGVPSPDGKWLAFTDKNYRLWILNLEAGTPVLIATSDRQNFRDLKWSENSKWLAFVSSASNQYSQIKVYDIDTKEIQILTSDRVDSYSPAWSPDGKWIYFLSDRYFRNRVGSPWGPRQPEPYFDKTTKIYMVSLKPDERSPFLPDDELYQSDKQTSETEKQGEKSSAGEKKGRNTASAGQDQKGNDRISFEGIQQRVIEIPVPAGSYSNLAVNEKNLFWMDRNPADRSRKLERLKIDNQDSKPVTLMEGIRGYELSGNRKKLMVMKGNEIYVVDAAGAPPKNLSELKVDLGDWSFFIDPKEEWRQMLIEAWRLERDYFYDPDLHKVDYDNLLKKHLPLVERVSDRYELSDLISHLVGELSALHIFVRGGDLRSGEDDITMASLGARLSRDENRQGYRIDHIFSSDPDFPEENSPLAQPGLKIKEGDIITEMNGNSLQSVADPSVLLRNQAGKQVLLKVLSNSTGKVFYEVVSPISSNQESNLRYHEWEYQRRLIVEEKGNDDLGYVHLRAMSGNNYSEWVKNYYPVYNRKGLIIDVRHNRGGNIDSWILEKLLRKAWFYWKPRVGEPTWNMQYAFRGHMVVLCNERTASDGEAFAEGFRRLGLGKLIGTRTWGGEIWLSSNNFLVDRGIATAAETGVYGPEGEWLIEGHGVDPDIVIDNLPHETFMGRDAQLERAILYLQEMIRKEPVEVPQHPPYPDKSFRYQDE